MAQYRVVDVLYSVVAEQVGFIYIYIYIYIVFKPDLVNIWSTNKTGCVHIYIYIYVNKRKMLTLW